jgi:hypothetical protein
VRLVALLLVACGSASHPAKPAKAPYLVLFERGKAWTLPIEIVDGHKDKESGAYIADQTARGTARCVVADVHPLGEAKVAKLACGKPYDDLLAAGVWVATRSGLFHPPSEPTSEDVASYQTGEPLITAAPHDRRDDQAVEDSSTASEAFVFDHAWCVRETTAAELDRRDYTLCFDAKGISGGGEIVIVGPDQTWRRARFGNAPRDPDDPTENKK